MHTNNFKKKPLLTLKDIEEQLKKLQSNWQFENDVIQAELAFYRSEIGETCFHLGQHFEKKRYIHKAVHFYVTGADTYHHEGCLKELEKINASEKKPFGSELDLMGDCFFYLVFPWIEFVFKIFKS